MVQEKDLVSITDAHRSSMNDLTTVALSHILPYLDRNKNQTGDSEIFMGGLVTQLSPYITIASSLSADAYNETRLASSQIAGLDYGNYQARPRRTPATISKAFGMSGVAFDKLKTKELDDLIPFYGNLTQKVLFTSSRETGYLSGLEDPSPAQIQRVPRALACDFCLTQAVTSGRYSDGTFHDFCRCVDATVFPGIKPGTFVSSKTQRKIAKTLNPYDGERSKRVTYDESYEKHFDTVFRGEDAGSRTREQRQRFEQKRYISPNDF